MAQNWSKTGEMRRLTRIVAAAVLGAALAVGGPAAADPHGKGNGRGWGQAQHEWRGGRGDDGDRGGRGGRGDQGGRGWRDNGERGDRGDRDRGDRGRHGGGRWSPPPEAYGPPPGWRGEPPYTRRGEPPGYAVRRGGRIPPEYRGAIVPDYGSHRLRPPPPGFAWVRMGSRYMLVSRDTGQIFDVIEP